jgi:transketolase
MTVIVPADMHQAYAATRAIAHPPAGGGKPAYLRLGRSGVPTFTTAETPFEIGKAQVVYDPSADGESADVTIIACGSLVYEALQAAKTLEGEGIHADVINLHTIKPIDRTAIIAAAKKTGAIVTAEEHQIMGGMGSAVAEVIVEEFPIPIEFVGVRDQFGQSGTPEELLKFYKVDRDAIRIAVQDVIRRK